MPTLQLSPSPSLKKQTNKQNKNLQKTKPNTKQDTRTKKKEKKRKSEPIQCGKIVYIKVKHVFVTVFSQHVSNVRKT